MTRRYRFQRRPATFVAFDRDDACCTLQQQRTGESSRPGANLDHRLALEGPCRARDTPCQIEIEYEVLAEALLGREARIPDHLTQRR